MARMRSIASANSGAVDLKGGQNASSHARGASPASGGRPEATAVEPATSRLLLAVRVVVAPVTDICRAGAAASHPASRSTTVPNCVRTTAEL